MSSPFVPPVRNGLLNSLSRDEYERVKAKLEIAPLKLGTILSDRDRPVRHVYFMERGVVSLVNPLSDGTIIEIATIGNEGMVGLPAFLQGSTFALRSIVQVEGEALRMSREDLGALTQDGSGLRRHLSLYVQSFLTQIAQAATCNRIHTIEKRCARWLLMTHDRMAADTFTLTQTFLSQMLGVRRAGVNEVALRLHQAGLIAYSRGTITILDRKGLEASACECYEVIRKEFERLARNHRDNHLPRPKRAVQLRKPRKP